MEWLGFIADVVGISAALFAGWQAYKLRQERKREAERQDKKVKIMLKDPTRHILLPFDLRRRETTRAEILGRIGMIPLKPLPDGKPKPRFEILYTNTEDFLKRMYEIIAGKDDAEFIITCKPDELDQFNLQEFQHLIKPN
jgi:hypothetical protein